MTTGKKSYPACWAIKTPLKCVSREFSSRESLPRGKWEKYIHIYILTYTHIYKDTYIHIHIQRYIYVCVCVTHTHRVRHTETVPNTLVK